MQQAAAGLIAKTQEAAVAYCRVDRPAGEAAWECVFPTAAAHACDQATASSSPIDISWPQVGTSFVGRRPVAWRRGRLHERLSRAGVHACSMSG